MKFKKIILCITGLLCCAVLYTFCASRGLKDSSKAENTATFSLSPAQPIATDAVLSAEMVPPTKHVTIFIHGTRMIRFFPLNLFKTLSLFDENMSTPKFGLHHYSEIPSTNNQVRIAKTLNRADPINFPLDTFYIFGWSGKLDIKERRRAAKQLIADIKRMIIEPFKEKYNITPTITIITHSHGGNVALNMARSTSIPFSIENLVLLACPVQYKTMDYSKSGIFKNIYSIFSKNDTLQVLDPQFFALLGHKVKKAWHKKNAQPLKSIFKKLRLPFFSKRTFGEGPYIYHTEVAWKDDVHWSEADFDVYGHLRFYGKKLTAFDGAKHRGLRHIEFLIPTFIEQLPAILQQAQTLKKDSTFYL